MPKLVVTPPGLRPYLFHGVMVESRTGTEGVADCPFCDKPKFYIDIETTQYHCKSCGDKGNALEFVRKLHAESMKLTKDYSWITEHRGLSKEALREWGVCQSYLTLDWIIPGYNKEGKINNLYKYCKNRVTGKYVLYATPKEREEMTAGIFGFQHYDETKPDLVWCEGPWDGISLYDKLKRTKRTEDGSYAATANASLSLLSKTNVLATPGSNTFLEPWNRLVDGKDVFLLFDNDYPKTNPKTGVVSHPGYDGMKHATGVMASAPTEEQPKSISFLDWGNTFEGNTEIHNTNYADGFDVRDMLAEYGTEGLGYLFDMISVVPDSWKEGKGVNRADSIIDPTHCKSWEDLVSSWKRWGKMTPEFIRCLAVCLASCASVKSPGEQLWIKFYGPPASGKSTICEALAVAKKYVIADSGMNGFYSGYKSDKEGEKDHSLAARLFDKTLVTKEGATLLSSVNKELILGQARDLYDGQSRRTFNNGVRREYEGLRFTWILAGTSSLRQLDQSELGQRFLDCVLMDEINDEHEDDVIDRATAQQARNMLVESNCKASTTHDEDYLEAMKMTGGYVEHLRKHSSGIMGSIDIPESAVKMYGRMGKFAAYMRARPSTVQAESQDRELGTRLAKQLVKLSGFLAVVMNKNSIADPKVEEIVRAVAMDTSRGRTLEIVKQLYKKGDLGMEASALSKFTNQTTFKEGEYLRFLRKIKAVEFFSNEPTQRLGSRVRWRLTEAFRNLYKEVVR